MAVTHEQDIKSFQLVIPDTIQKTILDCTNMERRHVFKERWKEMDQTHLHAYFGVLILAGVFTCNGESTESLWDAETDCMARYDSNTIIKFADDRTVVGLITNNDETAYRDMVRELAVGCQDNNLSLNVITTG
jgi:hypothetical protein